MSILVNINGDDVTSLIESSSLSVEQNINQEADYASFTIKKYGNRTFEPDFNDDVEIYDEASKIFGGKIIDVSKTIINAADGVVYSCRCVDHLYELNARLVSEVYENMTIEDIIDDIITGYAPTFTTTNVSSTFTISRIVFNQVPVGNCIKRLADIVQYYWYIDPDKDIHFFPKLAEIAPFNVTDINAKIIPMTLQTDCDGSQVANVVKVRGGEYNGAAYTDTITINGTETKSIVLPYKFANLTVSLNGTPQSVGIDNINDFTTDDVLYNYNEKMIRFENPLANGDEIEYSGNPKIPVLSIASDDASIALYGEREKLIRDTTIEDLDTARRRASAELLAFANEVCDAKFATYESGLRAGQSINVSSTLRGFSHDLVIKQIRFVPHTRTAFKYDVTLVTTRRYEFIELLAGILQPEPRQDDEREVSETIKAINETVSISETITNVPPYQADETVTVGESINKDPVGAGVEPTWVLGFYAPTSVSDTKRMGLLDRSMKVY